MTHKCKPYTTARGELVNPANQGGIGCPVCLPPDGRVHSAVEGGGSRADKPLLGYPAPSPCGDCGAGYGGEIYLCPLHAAAANSWRR